MIKIEELLPYKCRCGGILKKSITEVEFFGINFGIKECEVCTKCNAEYLDNEVIQDIQEQTKKLGIFGLERNLQISKSGNSLILRIPVDIAKFMNIRYKTHVRVFPNSKKCLQIEILG